MTTTEAIIARCSITAMMSAQPLYMTAAVIWRLQQQPAAELTLCKEYLG